MEDDLVRRAQHGDERAFETLIMRHREAMFRCAYLIVNDAQIADDVTQEAVLRIYKHIENFETGCSFRPWALQITRNLARNQNRAWGRYKHMLKRLVSTRPKELGNVEALTHAQLQAQDLHTAVRQLPADFQDVIFARYFMELSVEESAVVLGIAPGTVKSRAHRAIKQLKTVIEQRYPHLNQEFSHE